jgi:hypothetical protein
MQQGQAHGGGLQRSRCCRCPQAPRQPATKQSSSFLPFLPGDNGALGDPTSHEVLEIINEDLARLLRLKPAEFWQAARSDRSLKECIDSYLRYCR